jgi:ABC-type glutathione transport system ATPase component
VSSPPLIEAHNLSQSVTVRGESRPRTVFESLALSAAAGDSLAVVSADLEAGAALARTLALLTPPQAGQVLLEGEDVTRLGGARLRALRRRLQYVGGDARRSLSPRLTLEAILAEPLEVHRLGSAAERQARVEAAAEAWGLNRYLLTARPAALSAVQCARAAVARAQILQPRVLITDGLDHGLEPGAVRPLLARLRARARTDGYAWVWVTRSLELARDFAGAVWRLEAGALVPEPNPA